MMVIPMIVHTEIRWQGFLTLMVWQSSEKEWNTRCFPNKEQKSQSKKHDMILVLVYVMVFVWLCSRKKLEYIPSTFSVSFLFQSLFREVSKYPLHGKLKGEESYCFMFVNRLGEKVGNTLYLARTPTAVGFLAWTICSCSFWWPWPWYKLTTVDRQRKTFRAELSRQLRIKLSITVQAIFTWPWFWKHLYGRPACFFHYITVNSCQIICSWTEEFLPHFNNRFTNTHLLCYCGNAVITSKVFSQKLGYFCR